MPDQKQLPHHELSMEVINCNEKKEIPTVLFWFCMTAVLALAYQNIPFFKSLELTSNTTIGICVIVFTYAVFIVCSCLLGPTKWQIFYLCVMLDKITLALAAAIVGFAGMLILVMTPSKFWVIVLVILMNFELILFATTFRIMMAFCKWERWQVISTKLVLFLSCGAYFYVACDIIILGFHQSFNATEETEQKLIQFSFLYIFGLFTFVSEIYGKITDLDGTSEFKHHYSILPSEKTFQNSFSQTEIIKEVKVDLKKQIKK